MSAETIQIGQHRIVLARSSRRRTTSLEIINGEIKLRCPQRAALKQLILFAQSKEAWLDKHLQFIGARPTAIPVEDGLELTLLEQTFTVRYDLTRTGAAEQDSESREILIPLARCKHIDRAGERKLIALLKNRVTRHITERATQLSSHMNLSVNSIQVKDYKRRWGSCDRKANLTFNWRLIFAPLDIVDYVIVHELSHIKVFNHSRKFWQLVGRYYPDYTAAKHWFHANGAELYRFARVD